MPSRTRGARGGQEPRPREPRHQRGRGPGGLSARAEGSGLYLFDVSLPDGDGIELARELSEHGPRRPVVILTGLDAPDVLDRSMEAGVLAHLTKPVDDRQLEAALRLAAARNANWRRCARKLTPLARRSPIAS